jgi:hypothetical protein
LSQRGGRSFTRIAGAYRILGSEPLTNLGVLLRKHWPADSLMQRAPAGAGS